MRLLCFPSGHAPLGYVIRTGTRRIMRPDELSSVVRRI